MNNRGMQAQILFNGFGVSIEIQKDDAVKE